MNQPTLKASSISNLTDARYFSAMGAEWLGFSLQPDSENYLSATEMRAMAEWLVGPKLVGEFSLADEATLKSAVELLKLDAIQVGQFTLLEEVEALVGSTVIIREWVLEQLSDLAVLETYFADWANVVDYFLLDLEKNGISWSAIKADKWALNTLQNLCNTFPIMLSFRFEAEELSEILASISLFGIALKGGEEEKVGYKSFDALDAIFDELEKLA